jgi:hypothetical protein
MYEDSILLPISSDEDIFDSPVKSFPDKEIQGISSLKIVNKMESGPVEVE